MGQIIRLSVAAAEYPDQTAALGAAECVLPIAVRWWADACWSGEDAMPHLRGGLEAAGARAAAVPIDGFMTAVARTLRRPPAIHCRRCPGLSVDETHLLHDGSLAQSAADNLAAKVLRTTLLSASGAEFACVPLEEFGNLLSAARLLLRRRTPPTAAPESRPPVEPWLPDAPSCAAH